ncbi:MBL fold metallo-hydrolase [Martelella mangrovi]|uniref:L-ascorbate metabolism protein UlaG (Beta-lactamase superfamily) n=1 Tax=Martelella mangrovi TaxID=1397477 RepID=A0ABV2IEL4_9HYPH
MIPTRMRLHKKNRYYAGPESDHFDGTLFFNPDGMNPPGLAEVAKWQFAHKRTPWPKQVECRFAPHRPDALVEGNDMRVTMIGHASLLIQVAGVNILTDPVFSERVSPFNSLGPKRVCPPGIAFEDLPKIDLVLVTHNHYDHLSQTCLKRLQAEHAPRIVTPLGNDTVIRRKVPDAMITVLDWGHQAQLPGGVRVFAEPCHHWSARGVMDRRMALWAAFVLETPAGRIYHIGDTGFHEGRNYRAAAEKYGSFRLANLPIGAYEPRFFMKNEHQDPVEAVKGFELCNAAYAAGHHFGTFQLTDEGRDDPVKLLKAALADAGIDEERFRPLEPGEAFDVPETG